MKPVECDVLRSALEAAAESSRDAGLDGHTSGQKILLNEQWAQSYVGIQINDTLRKRYTKNQMSLVTFETSVAWLEDFIAEDRGPGPKPGKLSDRQRFDIVAWSKGGRVAGFIEIKDQPIMQSYSKTADPDKICRALRRWPTVKWGIFLFSVRCSGTKKWAARQHQELTEKAESVFQAVGDSCGEFVRHTDTEPVAKHKNSMLWAGVTFRRPA